MKYKTLLVSTGFLSVLAGVAVGYWNCKPATPEVKKESTLTEERQNYFSVDSIENVFLSSLKIEATKDLEEKCANEDKDISIGSGVLLLDSAGGDQYILSVEHIIPEDYITCKDSGRKIRVTASTITAGGIKTVLLKKEAKPDLSLFRLEEKIQEREPFNGKMAKTVQKRDYVLGIGFPEGIKKYFISKVTKIEENTVTLDMYVIGGNSGGGVFRIHEDALELVGVVKDHNGGISSLEKTREFLRGTPLEDDYL